MASVGCDYFKSIFLQLKSNFHYYYYYYGKQITSMIVDGILNGYEWYMGYNNIAGLDKIPAILLKDSSVVVVPYLRDIFNSSLDKGIFPDWKHARISPIFKSGILKTAATIDQFQFYQLSLNFLEACNLQLYDYFTENDVLLHVTNLDFVKGILPLHHYCKRLIPG